MQSFITLFSPDRSQNHCSHFFTTSTSDQHHRDMRKTLTQQQREDYNRRRREKRAEEKADKERLLQQKAQEEKKERARQKHIERQRHYRQKKKFKIMSENQPSPVQCPSSIRPFFASPQRRIPNAEQISALSASGARSSNVKIEAMNKLGDIAKSIDMLTRSATKEEDTLQKRLLGVEEEPDEYSDFIATGLATNRNFQEQS